MTTTMPCQAPFQHQMCFVRNPYKAQEKKDILISYSPSAFYKKFSQTCFLYKWILFLKASPQTCLTTNLGTKIPKGFFLATHKT